MTRRACGCLLYVLIAGCGGSKAPPNPAAPAGASAGTVTCHLNCSGKEESAVGATEQEARDQLKPRVEAICNPDDGQYFIVCEATGG